MSAHLLHACRWTRSLALATSMSQQPRCFCKTARPWYPLTCRLGPLRCWSSLTGAPPLHMWPRTSFHRRSMGQTARSVRCSCCGCSIWSEQQVNVVLMAAFQGCSCFQLVDKGSFSYGHRPLQ